MLRQAWADFLVAQFLQSSELKNEIYASVAPLDAVLDKYQQSFEKLLKSVLLVHIPEQSQLAFNHRFVTDPRIQDIKKVKSVLEKFFQATASTTNYRAFLGHLERLVPNPEAAVRDEKGSISGLQENSQYPYTSSGSVVCPCDELATWHYEVLEISKDLRALFSVIQGDESFSEYTTGLKLPGSRKAAKKMRGAYHG